MSELVASSAACLSTSPFDAIRLLDANGIEYWSARDLMTPLGYAQWHRFEESIDRSAASCRNSGHDSDLHFCRRRKSISNVRKGPQSVADWHLSRYAAYLVAMNGDPRKPEIAQAQRYFCEQTRKAELASSREAKGVRPWSMRINDCVMQFKSRMLDAHPGCWAIVTEVTTELLLVEDVLAEHSFPLRLSDLPDGSIGRHYRSHRAGKPWALPCYTDCPLQTTTVLPDGSRFEAQPSIYQTAEREHFDRWFRRTYIPEQMPEYLSSKVARDRKRWEDAGVEPPSLLTVSRAADSACRRLTGKPAVLPNRLAKAMRLSHAPQQAQPGQGDLFAQSPSP